VLDAEGRALRRVCTSGWAATGSRGEDDAAAAWRTTSHDGPGAAPIVQGGAYSDGVLVAHDVDLEGVPWEIEEGMRDKVVIRYDQ